MARINWAVASTALTLAIIGGGALLPHTRWILPFVVPSLKADDYGRRFSDADIRGNSHDAQVARAYLAPNPPTSLKRAADLYRADSDDVVSVGLYVSTWTNMVTKHDEVLPAIKCGERIDPDNAWWWLMESLYWYRKGDHQTAAEKIVEASRRKSYKTYSMDIHKRVVEELRRSRGSLTNYEVSQVYSIFAALSEHHVVQILKPLVNAEPMTAGPFCRLSALAQGRSEYDYVGREFAVRTLIGRSYWGQFEGEEKERIEKEFENSVKSLSEQYPEYSADFRAAANLAQKKWTPHEMIENPLFTDRGVQFKRIGLTVIWLVTSVVMVLISAVLSRLAESRDVLAYAPFALFLVLPAGYFANLDEHSLLGVQTQVLLFATVVFVIGLAILRSRGVMVRLTYWMVGVLIIVGMQFVLEFVSASIWGLFVIASLFLNRQRPDGTASLVTTVLVAVAPASLIMFLATDTGLYSAIVQRYVAPVIAVFGGLILLTGAFRHNRAQKIQVALVAATLIPGLVFAWNIKRTLDYDAELGKTLAKSQKTSAD